MTGAALRAVVGHPGATRLLARLNERGRVPHALLIEGLPGSGRRTLARAIAAALLCPSPVAGDACGGCRSCALVAAGTHPDLVELAHDGEAFVEPSVEIVRDQVANASSESPLIGARRVFIVYAIERLRSAAANALLKVLEEPPPGTHLLLTTAAAAGVLPTIRSRAQLIRLQPLAADDLGLVLARGGIAPAVAAQRARAAGGSQRGQWRASDQPAPLAALRHLLEAGLASAAVADAIAGLPSKDAGADDGSGAELSLPALQRRALRGWLEQLAQGLRADLRGDDAPRAAERIERVLAALRDLQRNISPRMVIESLGLPVRA